jgi:PAP2 superfamily C-terminal
MHICNEVACISTSISNDSIFAIALWSMVVMDFMVEIYEGFHYSVDMWLGIVLVTLLWNVLQSFEGLPPVSQDSSFNETALPRQQQPQETLSIQSYVAYTVPGLVAYLQLIVIPQDIANIVIVLYVLSAVLVYVQYASKAGPNSYLRKWYIHYAQHILLCLVFMALGIYL